MQFHSLRTCCVVAFLFSAHAPWIQGQTALLAPIADTSLFESNPLNNLGGLDNLPAGTTANGLFSRALLKFDLSASVPAGAIITEVSLFVTVVKAPLAGGTDSTFALHRVLRDWGEGDKSGPMQGSPATTGEATWLSRFHPTTLWADPGGRAGTDYAENSSSVVLVSGLGPYLFPSSAALIADAQSWLDNPANNFGWMLKSEEEENDATARRFASRENQFGDAPQLVVKYTTALRIRRVEISGNDFCLHFPGKAGKGYTVERRNAVESGMWTVVTNLPPVAADGELSVCDPVSSGNRFYRVGQQ